MALAHILLRTSRKLKTVCKPAYLFQLKLNSSSHAESFLCGANANYLEAQYLEWSKSKESVDASWDGFYNSLCGPTLKIEEMLDDDLSPTIIRK